MPLIYRNRLADKAELGIWKITETDDCFKKQLRLNNNEILELDQLSPKKKTEWLASRCLLHFLLGQTDRISTERDQMGKPYLTNSEKYISLSHSADLAAVIISNKASGIDIQHYTPKIERIATKFMSEPDFQNLSETNRQQHLTVYWGAKESLYKAYGKRLLDFKEHILISKLNYTESGGMGLGKVKKDSFESSYRIYFFCEKDFSLTYCLEE
ncbi:MAG: 4'-phosphopantetheinyl transferase family protein [Saprospiraceae bacterium]